VCRGAFDDRAQRSAFVEAVEGRRSVVHGDRAPGG
jgi:hypothetical protein